MLRNLTLTRPLAAIDCETTGLLEDGARIVELAIIRVAPDLSVRAQVWRLNPGIPIPAQATGIHGITDTQVRGCPTFGDVLDPILDLLFDCDITGFNVIRFDLPVIRAELSRAGWVDTWGGGLDAQPRLVLDSMAIFHQHFPPPPGTRGQGNLAAACRRYLGGIVPGAHGALCDALVALQVLDAQVVWHTLPGRPADLVAELAARPGGEREPAGVNGYPLFNPGVHHEPPP